MGHLPKHRGLLIIPNVRMTQSVSASHEPHRIVFRISVAYAPALDHPVQVFLGIAPLELDHPLREALSKI
jgi:hypothetical protein